MAEFVDYNGLKKFLQKMRGEFLSQESANLIYVKKTDATGEGNFNQAEIESLIQNALEKVDWQEDGENLTYGKLYRNNVSPYIKLSGVNSAENIQVKEKSVTIPADNFNSKTQITIESSGYSYSFGKSFNVKLLGTNTTLENSGGNDSISNFNLASDTLKLKNPTATLTDTVENGNTTLILSDGGTVLLEGVESGTIKILLGKYQTEYEIGVGMPTDFAINTESNVTLSTIESGKTRWINLADNVSISQDEFVAENYGANVTITGSSGDDSIFNHSSDVTIEAGTGNDSISNNSDNVSIDAGEGNNSITSSGKNVAITGGSGNDYISLYGATNNTIEGGFGNNRISLDGATENVISCGAGSDTVYLYNGSANNTIFGNAADNNNKYIYSSVTGGNVFMHSNGYTNYEYIYGYSENDSIQITTPGASIAGEYDHNSYRVSVSGGGTIFYLNKYSADSKLQIFDANGDKMSIGNEMDGEYYTNRLIISNTKNSTAISPADPAIITNKGAKVTIKGSWGSDSIANTGASVNVNGNDGDDTITNSGNYATLSGGNGNDSIYNTGNNVYLDAGKGNNTIVNSGTTVSLFSDEGDSYIYNSNTPVTIRYGDGDHTVCNTADKVSICGTLRITNASISNSGNYVSIRGSGNDTITNSGNYVTIYSGKVLNSSNAWVHFDYNTCVSLAGNNQLLSFGYCVDGNDSVWGFKSTDSIQFDSSLVSYSGSSVVGNDLCISIVSDNSKVSRALNSVDYCTITLKDYVDSSGNYTPVKMIKYDGSYQTI